MPQYIFLIKAGPFGAASMLASGRGGAQTAKENLEALGAKNVLHYPVTGQYDLVIIADFVDDVTCLAAGLLSHTEGFQVEQLRAYSVDEMDQARHKLETMAAEEASGEVEE